MTDAIDLADSGPDQEYKAVVERYETQPNQCTIFRTDVGDAELTTTWITANEGSYVDLALVR